jgi:predicted RND superfamily exporter protein
VDRWLTSAFRRRFLLVALAAVLALGALAMLPRVVFDTNVLNLLPQHGPAVRAFEHYLERFGSLDRLFVVFEAPAGESIDAYDAEIDRYVAALRALPEIEFVDAGVADAARDWSYVFDRRLLLFRPGEIEAMLARFESPGVHEALAASRELLATPASEVRELVRQDPLGFLRALRARFGAESPVTLGADARRGYVSADESSRLVIARPAKPPYDSAFARELNARVDALAAALPPGVAARALGGYRIADETETTIRRESVVNNVTSAFAITLLMFVVFRSVRPVAAIAAPIAMAAIGTVAIYGAFAALSPAAAASAAIMFGLGVDSTVLLYLDYLGRRREGAGALAAVGALAPPVRSIAVAVGTTSATFLGLWWVDLPALQDLGVVSGLGVLLCGACAIALFPAMAPRNPSAAQLRPLKLPSLATFVRRRRTAIVAAAIVATTVLGVSARALRFTPSVQKLAPAGADLDAEGAIAERFGLPADPLFVMAEGDALEPQLEAHARLTRELAGQTSAVRSSGPSVLLPPAAEQAHAARLLAAVDANQVVATVRTAAIDAGFRPDSLDPFVTGLPRLLDPSQRLTLDGYRAHGLGDVIGHFVAEDRGRYYTVSYVGAAEGAGTAELEAAVARADDSLQLTGIPIVNRELERGFLPELAKGSAIGVTGAIVVLVVGFAGWRLALWSLVPVALGLVWSVGILALAGVELDLFSVFGLLMCVGIGEDYGVHLLHRRAREGSGGTGIALTETGPAVLLGGLTTIIGFGSLAFSSYGPLHALGLVTSVTVACCLVAALVVLPALLGDA